MPSSETRPGILFFKHVIRKLFLEDWVTKLVALAITLALWVGVTGLSTPTTRRMADLPLTLSYSNNTEVIDSSAQTVSLVLSGDKRKINQITENEILISVDLSELPAGERLVNLTPDNVLNLPLGVKVQEIQPNKIQVRLDAVEEKEIPVKIETQGDIPDGFELYSEAAIPAQVKVRGPAGFLKTLSSISTDKVDIAGQQADFTAKQIPISVSKPKTTLFDTAVDVSFKIGEKRIEKPFSVPVTDSPGKRATVVLFGGRSLFEGVRSSDLKVEIGANGSLRVILPPALDGKAEVLRIKLQ